MEDGGGEGGAEGEGEGARRLRAMVLRAYLRPGHPVAFSAPQTVARFFGISKERAKSILEHEDGYTLHREYKQPRVYNPYYVHSRREQVQADLIDTSALAAKNDGVRFLLVLIDIMTKKLWVYPLQNKAQETVRRALQAWLRRLRFDKPEKLMTDRGLEFRGARVRQLLASSGVEWQPALGTLKACFAERVNKSLQLLIYKFLTARETLRYIDVLPNLVETYNGRPHRSIGGMTPNEADRPASQPQLRAIFRERYEKIGRLRRARLPFKVGDVVRLKTLPKKVSSSSRAYAEQFHGEFYTIVRINRTLPIAMYYLRSMDTGELIEGGLYANELQRQRGNVWKIERVVAERVRAGRRELYVKWKYFSDRHNSWIPAGNVVQAF